VSAPPPQRAATPSLALQLYTMRSLTLPLDALLERVAAIGYEGVETVALQGADAGGLRAALARHGLRFASAHVGLRALREDPRSTLAHYAAAGAAMVVVPWLDPADRPATRAGWERFARELDALGAAAAAVGLGFAYHHHDFELVEVDGARPLDVIAEVADPGHVALELDVGWLVRSGQDPAAWIDRVAARCRRIHAKDLAREPHGDQPWADVGDGVVAWPAVAAASRRAGVPWWIVEHDAPADPWSSAERGAAAVRRIVAADQGP
jgi:sugar phosphate isomerase/epimerase